MDFSQALSYPYKSIAKVLSIVLALTIAFTVFLGMLLNSVNWLEYIQALSMAVEYNLDRLPDLEMQSGVFFISLLGLIAVMIVQGFWLSGYSIRVIRSAADGFEKLPDVAFGTDMKKGFYLFLASILYGLVFVPFMIIVVMLMVMTSSPSGESGLPLVIFCGAFLVAIPLTFLLGWGYYIGMARCAIEDNNRALFQIGKNISIARQNIGASFSLTGHQFLLAIVYGFLSQIVSGVVQTITSTMTGNSLSDTFLLLTFILPFMLSLGLNIIQQFSNMHLVAQFAANIGLSDEPAKR